MTQSAITTTARRIARELNASPVNTWLALDDDGHVIGRAPDGTNRPAGTYTLPSRFRISNLHQPVKWSQRQTQDYVTAMTTTTAIDRPELAYDLVDSWWRSDEDDQPRISADRFVEVHDATWAEWDAEQANA